jgi:peptidoglycan/LPS O-acetylase OafA/YrhL
LRIFAAVGVVLCHVGYFFTSVRILRKAEFYGYAGVEFFFLLSGFVLTWAWLNRKPKPSRFWWQRVAKLYPATFLLMAFAYLAVPQYERIPGPKGTVLDFTLLQAWWPSERVYFGGNGVSWSLSCEIFFYLLFPFVLNWIKSLNSRRFKVLTGFTLVVLVLAPVAASIANISEPLRYWLFFIFPPYQFGFFLLGMLMARAIASGLQIPRPSLLFALALAWLGVVVATGSVYAVNHSHGLPRPVVLLAALPAFLALLGAAVSKDIKQEKSILTGRILTYLGIVSFELYLIHKPLFFFLLPTGLWTNSGGFEGALVFLEFLGVAMLAAIVLHHLFEVPMDRILLRSLRPVHWVKERLLILSLFIWIREGKLDSQTLDQVYEESVLTRTGWSLPASDAYDR